MTTTTTEITGEAVVMVARQILVVELDRGRAYWRGRGLSVRVYPRTIRAEGLSVIGYVVVSDDISTVQSGSKAAQP